MRTHKRAITLLEVMIGIALLIVASGLVGWKMHQAIAKKRFQSELDLFYSRCAVCCRIAVASKSDWKGVLKKQGNEWIFQTYCDETPQRLKPLKFSSFELWVNNQKEAELSIDFISTGLVFPSVLLRFEPAAAGGPPSEEWLIPDRFHFTAGKQGGPAKPKEFLL